MISAYEYLMGIYYLYTDDSDKLREKLRKAEAALKRFDILPCTYEIAKKTAEIDAYLTRQGQTVELANLIIAATAIIHKLDNCHKKRKTLLSNSKNTSNNLLALIIKKY